MKGNVRDRWINVRKWRKKKKYLKKRIKTITIK